MFWVQLPLLVVSVAVVIVGVAAVRRARPEDVPAVFEAFAAAFGRGITPKTARRRVRREAAARQPHIDAEEVR